MRHKPVWWPFEHNWLGGFISALLNTMGSNPTTSIIIPTYNGETFLAHTLDSVIAQTMPSWELIVVDDGSQDRSVAIAREYAERDPRIRCVDKPNGGVAAARNFGFAQTSPETQYVAFLDQDDTWEPEALEALVAALEACPEAVGAHGMARFIDADGRQFRQGEAEERTRVRKGIDGSKLVLWPPSEPTTFAVEVFRNTMYTPGQGIKRRWALEKAGPFDAQTAPVDDWDMWVRLTILGSLAWVDRVVLNYRLHGSNVSNDGGKLEQADLAMRRKFARWPQLDPEQRRLVHLGYRFAKRDVMQLRLRWAAQYLAQGKLVQAAKQLRHAASDFVQIMKGLPT